MGQFIETQSQLVSEAKQARLEREQQKNNRKNVEHIKNNLKLYFETAFNTLSLYDRNINYYYNFSNVKEVYLKLLDSNTRDNIIYKIVNKKLWENEELMHQIDNIYMPQLTKTYKPYKEIYQEQQRQEREISKKLRRQEKEMLKSNPLSASDWDRILSKNLITGINQFEKMTGTKWGQSNNNTTKKIKRNSFIAFLNMILK